MTGLLLFGYLAASANDENKQDSLPPVETKPGFANYKPAFAGQTRVAGAKTTTSYKVEKIAGRLTITATASSMITTSEGRSQLIGQPPGTPGRRRPA